MKEIIIIRHSNWNLVDDTLTETGKAHCLAIKSTLGVFAYAVSSPCGRARETAQLLSGVDPYVDERAGILKSPPEFSSRVAKLRASHPFGVAGAIISLTELRAPLRQQGEKLVNIVKELFTRLDDGQRALIVSHDGTMVAAEKVLTGDSFDTINHTYGELEGFRVDESLHVTRLQQTLS